MKKLLKNKGMTQQELADTLGVHQTLVSQWCTGRTKPALEYVQRLARLLDVTTDELINSVLATPAPVDRG